MTCLSTAGKFSPCEGGATGQHLVQRRAERKDIRPMIDAAGVDELFGRHVIGRAQDRAGGRFKTGRVKLRRESLGQSEVGEFDLTASRQEDIGRLDIPVDQTDLVERSRSAPATDSAICKARATGRVFRSARWALERLPVDELHDDVELSFDLPAREDPHDTRRLEPGGEPRLAEESPARSRCQREMRMEEFHGDIDIQVAVAGLVHDAHAALPDRRFQPAPVDGAELQVRIDIVGGACQFPGVRVCDPPRPRARRAGPRRRLETGRGRTERGPRHRIARVGIRLWLVRGSRRVHRVKPWRDPP